MSAESNAWDHIERFTWWQGHPDMSQEETQLRDAAALSAEVADLLAIRARDAHDAGMSWAQVGEILGITRQSASARYTHPLLGRPTPSSPGRAQPDQD